MGSAPKYIFAWLIMALIMLAPPSALVAPAFAQNSGNLFQRLFGPDRKASRIDRSERDTTTKRRKSRNSAPAPAPAPEVADKLENARIVLVVGDFLAGGLAEGLETAFADSPGVRILDRTSGSSGIVRDDYYDWRVRLPEFLDSDNPSVVVMMIGANDRQDFRTTSPKLRRLSDEWQKEYEARAAALAAIVTGRNIPLVWVGTPSFQSSRMSSDMVAFNDIYRRIVADADAAFVDIWDGFVNENGAFSTSGPDINGQPARLRASDGINVTRVGRRKIAFYAEKPLRKILGDAVAPDIGELGPENLPQLKLDPLHTPRIDRTPPLALGGDELDGGSELLGATVEIKGEPASTEAPDPLGAGETPPAKSGRADDFSWKPAPGDDGKTGSTRP